MYDPDDVLFYIDGNGYATQVVKNPITLSCDVKKKKPAFSKGKTKLKKTQQSTDDDNYSICIMINDHPEKDDSIESYLKEEKVIKRKERKNAFITCSGCMDRQPGQLSHMDHDGCLFNDEFSIV
jgi:hypothetical protein